MAVNKKNGISQEEVADQVKSNDAEAKEAKKAKREQKDKAFKFLKTLADSEGADPNFAKALKILRPSLYGERTSGGGTIPTYLIFVQKVQEAGKDGLNEMDVFKEFHIGRREARNYLKKYLKAADVSERLWINFNEESTSYVVIGKGPDVPKTYEGFIPVDESVTINS